MKEPKPIEQTKHEWMELHLDALFTHDPNLRLLEINEPWPGSAPAPRFVLGRTAEGTTVGRYRHDVPDTVVEQLELLRADEARMRNLREKPKHFAAYMRLLQGRKFTMGPCFLVPVEAVPSMETVDVTRENAAELARGGFEWLVSEIDYAQPCTAIVREGRAVSICRSVRVAARAHEAGLETLEAFRGRGYAAEAVAGWARAVRRLGCLPLYSTSWENASSQRVAEKMTMTLYGANFTVI